MSRIIRKILRKKKSKAAPAPAPAAAPAPAPTPAPPPPPPAQAAAPEPTPAPTFGQNNMPVYNPAYAGVPQQPQAEPMPTPAPAAPEPGPAQVQRRRTPPTGLAGGSFQPIGGGMLDMTRTAQIQRPELASTPSSVAGTGLIGSSMQRPATGSISMSQLEDQRTRDQQYASGVDATRQGTSQFPVFNPYYNNRS